MRAILLVALLAGCGGSLRDDVRDAHDLFLSASDCVSEIQPNANVSAAIAECSDGARAAIVTLCASGVIPTGTVCDAAALIGAAK
jgi:hypothetical protein